MTDTKVKLSESLGGIVSETVAADGKRTFFGRIIEGNKQGSSGYYSREMLMEQGAKTFPAKTHMHIDHQSFEQYWEFPAGSLKDLAGFISDEPKYMELGEAGVDADGNPQPEGLYSHFTVGSEWAQFIHDFQEVIGLSIKTGAASIPWTNPATGEETELITQMENSALTTVDFVTHPGANGRILSLVESESYKLPPGFKLITNRPVAEAVGDKKEKAMDEELKKFLESLSANIDKLLPLMTADAAAREAAADVAKKEAEKAGEVDVVDLIAESSKQLVDSKLPEVSRDRVLEMAKLGKPLAEAIAAEVAYLGKAGVKLGETKTESTDDDKAPDFILETMTALSTAGTKVHGVSEADSAKVVGIFGAPRKAS